jgi:hypothetical protein
MGRDGYHGRMRHIPDNAAITPQRVKAGPLSQHCVLRSLGIGVAVVAPIAAYRDDVNVARPDPEASERSPLPALAGSPERRGAWLAGRWVNPSPLRRRATGGWRWEASVLAIACMD